MKSSKLFLAMAGLVGLSLGAHGAISVTGAGAGPLDFPAVPAVGDWSTLSVGTANTTYGTAAALDAAVQTLNATAIATVLGQSATDPSTTSGVARWNSTRLRLQSKPTGVDYLVLMATLQNDSGATINSVDVTYLYAVDPAGTEEIPGHRAFYSVGGAAGTWQPIPAFSGLVANGNPLATLATPGWSCGARVYIVWADDNAVGTEGGYTIDDFTVNNVVSGGTVPTSIAMSSPTNGQQIAQCADITVAALVTGCVQNVTFDITGPGGFMTNVVDTTFPFGFNVPTNPLPIGTYTLVATANDGSATPPSVTITVQIVASQPPVIAITNTYSGTVTGNTFLVGSPINVQASFSDDDAITNIEWQVDGVLYLTNRINNEWVYLNSLSGTHTLRGIATDRKGQQTVSANWTITITNPPAAIYTLLITNGSEWKYFAGANGAQPDDLSGMGVGPFVHWYAPTYSESGWATGTAELGNGDIPNGYAERTLIDIGPVGARYPSVYFRKTFNVVDPAALPNLVLRVLRDDGAIVWLNGFPVWTNNMATTGPDPVHPDTIANTNLALGSDDGFDYQVVNLLNLPSSPIISPGQNIIGVQVHQQNATSSDLSFDLMLWGEASTAPVLTITAPTNGQSFVQGSSVTVNVSASTFVTNVIFKYEGNVVGEDGTQPFSFVITNVGPPGARTIDAMGQDTFGAMGSAPQVTINVIANMPPSVVLTNPPTGSNLLVGTFVEVGAIATDTDGGIARVDFYDNGVLRLSDTTNPYGYTLNDLTAGNHTLTAIAVDVGGFSAASAPVMITVTNPPALTAILTNGAAWKYLDNGTDQGTAWQLIGFDDSGWSNGIADLGYGDGPGVPERTLVGFGPDTANKYITTYFRKVINVANPAAFTNVRLDSLHDDGVAVYINGTEVYRNNMLNTMSPLLYTDEADVAIGGVSESTYVSGTIPATALMTGNNIIAVEIHQDDGASSDISFDLMLWGVSAGGPPLTIVINGSNYEVSWSDPSGTFILQESSDVGSPLNWADVPSPTNPLVRPLTTPSPKFYRLRSP